MDRERTFFLGLYRGRTLFPIVFYCFPRHTTYVKIIFKKIIKIPKFSLILCLKIKQILIIL